MDRVTYAFNYSLTKHRKHSSVMVRDLGSILGQVSFYRPQTSPGQTPPMGRHLPGQTPPWQADTTPLLQAENPLGRHPPRQTPPRADTPLQAPPGLTPPGRQTPPPWQTPPGQTPLADSCCSGWYAL